MFHVYISFFCFIVLIFSSVMAQSISSLPVEMNEKNAGVNREGKGELLFNKSKDFYQKREYGKAIKYGQKAISINPNDYEAYSIIGMSYSEKGDFKRAIEFYQKSTNLNPYQLIVIATTAIFNPDNGVYQKNFNNALENYKKEIVKNPNNYRAYNELGYLSFLLKMDPNFEGYYKESIRIKPDYVQAHYNLALYYLFSNNIPLASEEYKIIERLDNNLAEVLLKAISLAEEQKEREG